MIDDLPVMREISQRRRILHVALILIPFTEPQPGAGATSSSPTRTPSWLLQPPGSVACGAACSRRAHVVLIISRNRISSEWPVNAARAVLSGRLRAPQDCAAVPGSQVTILDFFEAYSARCARSTPLFIAQPQPC